MTKYYVNHWGSHPEEDNDDCWTGEDFETKEEALKCFNTDADRYTQYIELGHYTGEIIGGAKEIETLDIRRNPAYKPSKNNDDGWQREIAMEAGMLHGVEAYNEVMGWGLGDSNDY